MPRTLIGIGPDAFADTVRATSIAVALQRLSALPIDTAVTGIDEALAGKLPAVIISADGWDQPDVPLPIRADQGRLTVNGTSADGKPDTLTLAPELRYGALQAFHDGRRSLLVATSNGAPAQLDALLGWVSADPAGSPSWTGSPSSARRVSNRSSSAPAGCRGVGFGPDHRIVWAAGAVTAVAIVGAALSLLLRNRRRSGGTDEG